MTTWKQLSRPLRLAIAAPWCLLAALATVAVTPAKTTVLAATRTLLLDAANHPTADVSLASSHWVDTLDAARLPASVPLLDGYNNLSVQGALVWDSGLSGSNGNGDIYVGDSIFLGDSTSGAGIYGPSGASWTDNGSGGWNGPEAFFIQDNSFGTPYAYGDYGALHAQQFVGTQSGANWNDDGGGGWYGPGSFFVQGSGGFGDPYTYDDGNGNFTVGACLQAADIFVTGNITGGSGAPLSDSTGAVFAGPALSYGTIGTSTGFLATCRQPYVDGVITPTGSFAIQDGTTGVIYLIPAVAQ